MPSDDQPVRCSCGEVLLDAMDDSHVVVGDDEFRFRRTTDFVGCTTCGTLYAVRDLKPGVNQVDDAPTQAIDDPLDELRKLSEELERMDVSFDLDADEALDDADYS